MKDIVERLNSLTIGGWRAYNGTNENGNAVCAIQDAAFTISNLRGQIDALTAERDMWRAQALKVQP